MTLCDCSWIKRSMIIARTNIEQSISGQMGQPAACSTVSTKNSLLGQSYAGIIAEGEIALDADEVVDNFVNNTERAVTAPHSGLGRPWVPKPPYVLKSDSKSRS